MPGGKVIINASHKHRHLTPQSTRLSRRKWVILPVYHHPLTCWFQRNVGFMRWCSSVCIVDPEMPLNDLLSTWDENSITWMHKYHVLKEEAQDTVVNSKHVWLDTPFSLYALHQTWVMAILIDHHGVLLLAFVPPRHPVGMWALLQHSLDNYGPHTITNTISPFTLSSHMVHQDVNISRPESSWNHLWLLEIADIRKSRTTSDNIILL